MNSKADSKRIYIVKADGSVALPGGSGWFRRKNSHMTRVTPLLYRWISTVDAP